ncbi:MAG: helix-turn-helix transcriptional regulator [Lachnospiraceae bacterium]
MIIKTDRLFYCKLEKTNERLYPEGAPYYYLQFFKTKMQVFDADGHIMDAPANSIYLVPPNTPMYFKSYSEWYLHDLIIFKADSRFMRKLDLPYMKPFFVPDLTFADHTFLELQRIHRSDLAIRQETEDAYVIRILSNLHEQLHDVNHHAPLLEGESLSHLRLTVFANIDYDWTAEKMAKQINMSIATFYRKYKKVFGKNPIEDLADYRLTVAKQLIEAGYSFSDILKLCGFKSLQHFSNFFKQHEGISPSEYRKQL